MNVASGEITAQEILSHFSREGNICDLTGREDSFRPIPFDEASRVDVEHWAAVVLGRITVDCKRDRGDNQAAFNTGWNENLEVARKYGLSQDSLKPRYYRPSSFLRYNRSLICPHDKDAEWKVFSAIRRCLFHDYLSEFAELHEFGCGSCANLLLFLELAGGRQQLRGYDWADSSVEIGGLMRSNTKADVAVRKFDMFEPGAIGQIGAEGAVVTIHAMEQLGERFEPMLQFLIKSQPGLVVQLEPILDFYDPDNLYDFVSATYCNARGYLRGYLSRLRELDGSGQIELIVARRTEIGGPVHEASSLIVWKPRNL